MLLIAGLGAVAVVALFVYVLRERLGPSGLGLAALRTAGLGTLIVLLINPSRLVERTEAPVTVLLDASASMGAAGGGWPRALDTARALARDGGTILRFGVRPTGFDSTPPDDGTSRLGPALEAAAGRASRVIVVTDGELDDWSAVPPTLVLGAQVIVVPRDTVAGAALLDAQMPRFARAGDSLPIALTIGTWGGVSAGRGTVEIRDGDRRLLTTDVELPIGPGTFRRTVTLPPGALLDGERVLTIGISLAGDREPRDDVRQRVVTVTEQTAVVVLVDPADWEGRFLVRTLAEVGRVAVRGFARVSADRWVDMERQVTVGGASVAAAARAANLVVVRGGGELPRSAHLVWRWPAGAGSRGGVVAGDWYVASPVPASPLAGRLGGLPWESIPPLSGVMGTATPTGAWVGLAARQGRRGVARPVLVGSDSAGRRALTVTAEGLWRWALRGGAALDAYRAFVASGLDWLLASEAEPGRERLTAPTVVPRGVPVTFEWRGGATPESVSVRLDTAEGDTTVVLRFDAAGMALVSLAPGVYRWQAEGVAGRGLTVVETYSDEFRPRAVTAVPATGGVVTEAVVERARGRWWLFALVIAALAGEWAWRQRRGLP